MSNVRYSILDPTGNITALVESAVGEQDQPSVAHQIMEAHPEVEQVGFVRYLVSGVDEDADVQLRMAGGEFCGNASMCAAALFVTSQVSSVSETSTVRLCVSGAEDTVEVRLLHSGPDVFETTIRMPKARGVQRVSLSYGGFRDMAPVVHYLGISHVILEPDNELFGLLASRSDAEEAVRLWCGTLGVDGLGLMFLEGEGSVRSLTPLVYVPVSNTVFWENSCASGSAAVGLYVSQTYEETCTLRLCEPGGELRVTSDPATQSTWLRGQVRLV